MFSKKGTRGYIRSKKIKYLLIAFGLSLAILGFIIIGLIINGDTKNIYTIMGVLTALPFANILTVYIALFPFSSPDEEEYKKIYDVAKNAVFSTELVITSSTLKSIMLSYVVVTEDIILAYSSTNVENVKDYEKYISGMLAAHSIQMNIKIFREFSSYHKFVKKTPLVPRSDANEIVLEAEGILKSISM